MASQELTPGRYISHHLTFNSQPVGEGGFWAIHIDTVLTAALLGVVALGFLWWVARGATAGVPGRRQALPQHRPMRLPSLPQQTRRAARRGAPGSKRAPARFSSCGS